MPLSNPQSKNISDIIELEVSLNNLKYHPGYAIGRYYSTQCYNLSGYASFLVNYVFYTYFYIASSQRFDRISTFINVAGASGSIARLGIYSVASGSPTSLIVDAGIVAIDTTGIKEAIIDITLLPGWYAFAYTLNSATATTICGGSSALGAGFVGLPQVTPFANVSVHKANLSPSFALPLVAGASNIFIGANSPILHLRAG